jgi:hypothetical protein
MIVLDINFGWGPEWPLKQFESQILKDYLRPFQENTKRVCVINSVWYSNEHHKKTQQLIQSLDIEQVLLVAMLDAAIPQADWFDIPTRSIGYYTGPDFIDYWALMVDKFFPPPPQTNQVDTAYMCLNRKPHWHRRWLYQQLSSRNLLDQGFVSMGGNMSTAVSNLTCDPCVANLAPNTDTQQHGIVNDIASLGDPILWSRHLINIVTETVFDIANTNFVSEKIYKPIQGGKPFLVYASDGALPWLHTRGFETYEKDFSDICNLDLSNPDNIPEFLDLLCAEPQTYLQSKSIDLHQKTLYNQNQFASYVKNIKQKINQGAICQI